MTKEEEEKSNLLSDNISFILSEHDCFKLRTGICSLDLSFDQLQEYEKETGLPKETTASYCRDLSISLLQESIFWSKDKLFLNEYSCGHMTFVDGQHRTCIARRQNFNFLSYQISPTFPGSTCPTCKYKVGILGTDLFST